MTLYRQCKMRKSPGGIYTAWIPMEKAKQGKILNIKINGEWVDGWKVVKLGTIKDESFIKFKNEADRSFGQSIK